MKNAPGHPVVDRSRDKLCWSESRQFTFYGPEAKSWEGKNFEIKVR
jgi:hypothetical protein